MKKSQKCPLPIVVLFVGLFLATGCQDRWSQRRIAIRNQHFHSTVRDIEKSEEVHLRRLGEAGQTIDRAWKMECERFRERSQQVGDYFW
jgi:hypothetical protein